MSTFIVTTTADSGAGSLRQAILQANAAGGSNSIQFSSAGSTIAIGATPLPAIASDLTIDGGAGVVIDGGGLNRIFFVLSGQVSFTNLTLVNGYAGGGDGAMGGGGGLGAGGAIFVDAGSTTISNVTFANDGARGGDGCERAPSPAPRRRPLLCLDMATTVASRSEASRAKPASVHLR